MEPMILQGLISDPFHGGLPALTAAGCFVRSGNNSLGNPVDRIRIYEASLNANDSAET